MPRRVFISSTASDVGEERRAALESIARLGLQPVNLEHSESSPDASERAFVEGVRISDVYLGILGERYGRATSSGQSATEIEFWEARRLGKPTVLFVREGRKEPAQEAFLSRVGVGRAGDRPLLDTFRTTEELSDKIVARLDEVFQSPPVSPIPGSSRSAHPQPTDSLPPGSKDTLQELVARYGPSVATTIYRVNRSWITEPLLEEAVYRALELARNDVAEVRASDEVSEAALEEVVRHAAELVAIHLWRSNATPAT
jgi:Domain of unknown function (DUF4062)